MNLLAPRAGILASFLLLFTTVILAGLFLWDVVYAYVGPSMPDGPHPLELILYALCGGLLIFSAIAHLLARLGYQLRLRSEFPRALSGAAENTVVGIIVPSYREEPEVIHRTLLSAALHTHPRKWITLLLDDPAVPLTAEQHALLERGRAAPGRVTQFLAPLLTLARAAATSNDPRGALKSLHVECGRYLMTVAAGWSRDDHENRLFIERVLQARARGHFDRADELRAQLPSPDEALAGDRTAR